jgi:AcrR family transcriptional regulator
MASASKTPERILETALALFNGEGEPNVTTNAIADEMDISPGNLHYHFHRKRELVEALFARFEKDISRLLVPGDMRHANVVDAWMQLHMMFELMWDYRFIYRDLAQLLAKYPSIDRKVARLMHRKIAVMQQGCESFGVSASGGEAAALARNIVLVMTYWPSFEQACGVDGDERSRIGRGAFQVMAMLLPYLDPDSRDQLRQLAGEYL